MIMPMVTYSAVRDDALGQHDLVGLVESLRRREVNAAELASAALDRAHDSQPVLNAVVSWATAPQGPDPTADTVLGGVPTFLKDNENLAGMATRDGSRALPDQTAISTSPIGELLADLGATYLGKSSMPEFGLTATTEPLLNGPTHNPWALGHSAGGSSGGAAALVAAGVVPFAHANDGGGSIRIPAACCGLVGLKPSRGRLPNAPESDQLPIRIVSQGFLTRSVRDTALLYAEAEKRHHVGDGLTPIGHVTAPSARRLRIGVIAEGLTGPVVPAVADVVRRTADLCADLGHYVSDSPTGVYPAFGRDFLRYWAGLAFALRLGGARLYGKEFDRSRLEPFTDGLAEFFGTVALGAPASVARLRRFPAQHAQSFESYDVLLSPTIGYPSPELGYLSTQQDFRTHVTRLLPFAGYTALHNVAGTPAISLPLGSDPTGRPIGVQFSAALDGERTLLELAYELEAAAPWPHTPD